MSLDISSVPPTSDPLYRDVKKGFEHAQKSIPSKYLYDDRGSQLFEEICALPEYYPTRTELALTKDHANDIAAQIGSQARLVDLGAGNGQKTRLLLNYLVDPVGYIPVDISPQELARCARSIQDSFPDLPVAPVCVDYTADWTLPAVGTGGRTVFYYPGSTIGNFYPLGAQAFLHRLAKLSGTSGGLLIGVDLHKDPALLEAAYNDAQGVTADFNLNLLRRINRECGADFNLDHFRHLAIYDRITHRIEMRLISTREQTVHFPDTEFSFEKDEYILTEVSHKYTIEDFAELSASAGWRTRAFWTDDEQLFSLWYLETQ